MNDTNQAPLDNTATYQAPSQSTDSSNGPQQPAPSPAGERGPDGAVPTVPGYQIVAELGRGGMGVVYKAWQTALKRPVALKMVLAAGHAGPEELARFSTEAEALARLQHSNIIQIHEVGEQAGVPFCALEFCSGGSLAARLAGTPLPAGQAAELVATLARAMHATHQVGVIHSPSRSHPPRPQARQRAFCSGRLAENHRLWPGQMPRG
jgi:serine/threonine protein kinase